MWGIGRLLSRWLLSWTTRCISSQQSALSAQLHMYLILHLYSVQNTEYGVLCTYIRSIRSCKDDPCTPYFVHRNIIHPLVVALSRPVYAFRLDLACLAEAVTQALLVSHTSSLFYFSFFFFFFCSFGPSRNRDDPLLSPGPCSGPTQRHHTNVWVCSLPKEAGSEVGCYSVHGSIRSILCI